MGIFDKSESERGKWLALTAALLGWLFDGAEMGVFSMVGRPAIKDLLGTTDEGVIGLWFGVVTAGFLVGAATGGVLFGWLGDRIGRVRAMTLSVLTYSLFTGLCGVAGQAWQIGALRFIAALGMGGEWSLGVALVMEVWPNRSRAFMAGLIGAAGNVGYMLVGLVGLGLAAVLGAARDGLTSAGLSEQTVEWLLRNQGWRLVMMIGTLPALLTFLIRLFVPESKKWQEEKGRGHTSGWATQDLLGVALGATGPALMVYLWAWEGPAWLPHTLLLRIGGSVLGLIVATAGYTYPLVRYLQRQTAPVNADHATGPTVRRMLLAACLSGVALLGTWGSLQWAASWADQLTQGAQHAKEHTQIVLAIGAIIGTLLAALMGDWFGRRPAYALLCLLSLGSIYLLFQTNSAYGPMFLLSAGLAGGATASFYGWLPLYLPELFPTRVRATGQGFGYNFGRILAAVGALQTGNLLGLFQKDVTIAGMTFPHGYPLACTAMSLIYLVGVAIIWLAPETRGRPLPE
jgi:MFS family permease